MGLKPGPLLGAGGSGAGGGRSQGAGRKGVWEPPELPALSASVTMVTDGGLAGERRGGLCKRRGGSGFGDQLGTLQGLGPGLWLPG